MSIDAMKQALEALEILNNEVIYDGAVQINVDVEITALRAAIAEAAMQRLTDVQQEMEHIGDANKMVCRKWVGLTDEEIAYMRQGAQGLNFVTFREFCIVSRAIEAKLKEKNND
jgi:hypothetical protein